MPSQVVRLFDYQEATRRLTIVFQSGRRYIYRDVPPEIVAEFKTAKSKGEYFNTRIRDHFSFERAG